MTGESEQGGRGRVVGMPFLALVWVTLYVLVFTFNAVTDAQTEILNREEIVCSGCGGFQVLQVAAIVLVLGGVVSIIHASGYFTEREADEDV